MHCQAARDGEIVAGQFGARHHGAHLRAIDDDSGVSMHGRAIEYAVSRDRVLACAWSSGSW